MTSLRLPKMASHSSKKRMQLDYLASLKTDWRFYSVSPMYLLTIWEMLIL